MERHQDRLGENHARAKEAGASTHSITFFLSSLSTTPHVSVWFHCLKQTNDTSEGQQRCVFIKIIFFFLINSIRSKL